MVSYEREPLHLVGLQAAVAAAVVLLVLPWGFAQSESAFLGAAVVVAPNAWFAWVTGRAEQALSVLAYALIKFVLVLVGAGLVLGLVKLEPLGFFAGFGAALLLQIMGPLVGRSNIRGTNEE